jgi:hypothetical protein
LVVANFKFADAIADLDLVLPALKLLNAPDEISATIFV